MNGLRFSYLEEGKGPLVLLLHGFPDTAHTWDRAMRELAGAGFRAVAPFMRGYHPTEIPTGGFDLETLGRDVLGLIEALGEQQAIVVGHDWGAASAYAATGLDPTRVKLLVTLAIPHARSLKRTPRQLWALRHFLVLRRASIAAKIRADDMRYIDELWRRWSPAWKDLPASETEAVKRAFAEPGCLEAACAYYAALPLTTIPKAAALRIQVPTVAFAGEHDSAIHPRTFEKARIYFDKSYEVIQVPGGHFLHREHPDHFIPELLRVVRDVR